MSGITGSGGPGGPKGPSGPDLGGPDEVEPGDAGGAVAAHGTSGIADANIDQIAADLDAGRITGREALDRLIDEAVGQVDAADRAELREVMADLIANDPHLAALAARIGARGGDD